MEIELDIELNKRTVGLLTLGLILGILVTIGFSSLVSNGKAESESLRTFFENQSGQQLEVVETEKANDFYRVEVRTQDDQLNTYYTDGEVFTANMQDMENIRSQVSALVSFQECLADSGTVMFGNASQQPTQNQIQALGGQQVVAPIYQDVSNNETLAQAVRLGIQEVPAFYNNESALQGVQSPQQVAQFTGCSLQG